jgi:hypothetical protein
MPDETKPTKRKAGDFNWDEVEIRAIKDYLDLRAGNCLEAIASCEKMQCDGLNDWVRKEYYYWRSMLSCIRWLHANVPKPRRKLTPRSNRKGN